MNVIRIQLMIKSLIKNKKGSALLFTMILIANAVIITSSIVFISAMQTRTAGVTSSSATALQEADSGFEYVLQEINQLADLGTLGSTTIDTLCTGGFSSSICLISGIDADIYFMDNTASADMITSGDDYLDTIGIAKVIGSASNGEVTRSLETELIMNQPPTACVNNDCDNRTLASYHIDECCTPHCKSAPRCGTTPYYTPTPIPTGP